MHTPVVTVIYIHNTARAIGRRLIRCDATSVRAVKERVDIVRVVVSARVAFDYRYSQSKMTFWRDDRGYA